jgi:octaprenyl-diphosphate synthase
MYLNCMNTVKALAQLATPEASPLLAWSEPLREALEQRLRQLRQGGALPAIAADLFAAGGKRLRGLVALSMAQAAGLDDPVALTLAEAIELAHGATLLHDDVIDEAALRRGRPAARVRWCNTLSILGGDYVLLRALRAIDGLGSPALMALFLATLDEVIAAEALQHVQAEQGSLDVEGYLQVAGGKTGALFGLACAAPSLLAGHADDAERLGLAGRQAGIAFQILDDVGDVRASDPGKQGLQDALDGVPSLPLRLAAQRHPVLGQALRQVRQGTLDPAQAQQLVRLHVDAEVLARAIALGYCHLEASAVLLAQGRDDASTHPLRHLLDWIGSALGGRTAGPLARPERGRGLPACGAAT